MYTLKNCKILKIIVSIPGKANSQRGQSLSLIGIVAALRNMAAGWVYSYPEFTVFVESKLILKSFHMVTGPHDMVLVP